MDYFCQVPGKTFLIGEYAVLQGAPALVLTSSPCFEFEIKTSQASGFKSLNEVFHPQSPAGQWIQKNPKDFSNCFVKANDPYMGRGGFGASTAQFISVWKYSQKLKKSSQTTSQLLQDYWDCSWAGVGARPSGADLVAQYHGGLLQVLPHGAQTQAESVRWPWPEMEVYLISTGFKVATHEHLKNLTADSKLEPLKEKAQNAREHFQKQDLSSWLQDLNEYAQQLKEMNLVTKDSSNLQTRMKDSGLFLAVKGCGALGADVILAVCESKKSQQVESFLKESKMSFYLTTKNISARAEYEN